MSAAGDASREGSCSLVMRPHHHRLPIAHRMPSATPAQQFWEQLRILLVCTAGRSRGGRERNLSRSGDEGGAGMQSRPGVKGAWWPGLQGSAVWCLWVNCHACLRELLNAALAQVVIIATAWHLSQAGRQACVQVSWETGQLLDCVVQVT